MDMLVTKLMPTLFHHAFKVVDLLSAPNEAFVSP